MPDRQRPLRRSTATRPLARAVAHLLVIGLVAVTAAFGIAAARSAPDAARSPALPAILSFDLVAQARGAAASLAPERSVAFELTPDPNRPDPMLSRRMDRVLPTPLPTPVAPPSPTPEPRRVAAAPKPVRITGNGALVWPVSGGTITQYYHAGHLALDVAAPYSTTVVAADDGVVTWAGWRNNGGGLVIVIDHGNGIVTGYNHLGSISVGRGQAVARGQAIAAVGCTGICTGPHVHFETIVGGVIVNPLRYL
ncbi:MAG: M23 family metallopeptidase [Candidatus Limnocylindria bacterium]